MSQGGGGFAHRDFKGAEAAFETDIVAARAVKDLINILLEFCYLADGQKAADVNFLLSQLVESNASYPNTCIPTLKTVSEAKLLSQETLEFRGGRVHVLMGAGVEHLIGESWNEVLIQFAHTYPRQGVLARDQNATALKEGEEANVI